MSKPKTKRRTTKVIKTKAEPQFHAAPVKGQSKVIVNLGIPTELHAKIAEAALADERSVNHFCVMVLKKAMETTKGADR
jgi:predicted HicB family RNase H-like nuclease